MLLAALLDAGATAAAVDAALHACGVGARVGVEEVSRAGLRAALLRIEAADQEPAAGHDLGAWIAAVAAAALPARLRDRAVATLRALGETEARLHAVEPGQLHLHELGSIDTMVDVVGVCAALEEIGTATVSAGALPAGSGSVETAHGTMPLPAPATLLLLAGAGAPLVPGDAGVEQVTPTGAALLATIARFEPPRMILRRVGHGAGSRDDRRRPNLVRAWVGESLPSFGAGGVSAAPAFGDAVVELRTNLDDATPAEVAGLAATCLEAGALDAWVVAATMKKGRPGSILHLLAGEGTEEALATLLLTRGPTLGVRRTPAPRLVAERDVVCLDLDGEPVRVKRRLLAGRVLDARPELEDCARIATRTRRPLEHVVTALTAAARRALRVGEDEPAAATPGPPLPPEEP